MSDEDKCLMDDVMASCQHIEFIEERLATAQGVEIKTKQLVPPGHHYLFGAVVVNSSSEVCEVA